MSGSGRLGADEDGANALTQLREWYHVPALVLVMAYMLWVRLRSYDNFVRGGEVFFTGNDPYYHYRETTYVVKNWPATMPYDPWTNFPYGTSADQFGTLFDQIVATAALVVGLGDPSALLIGKTLIVAPAVFGTAVAIPVYFLGRRMSSRFGGLFGVVVLALLPGSFLRRSLVGAADHHPAEAFFQALAVLGIVVALAVAHREKPVYELILDRDMETLRAPLGWGAIAGVGMALYVWSWPPGILLFAIGGLFFAVKLAASHLNGRSPEPVAFAGAVSMGTAGVLTLLPINGLSVSPTQFGLLQPGLAFAVAVGCVFMAWLSREWDSRDLDERLYPAAVSGIALVGIGVVAVALPDVFDLFVSNFKRFVGFSAGAESRTIGEAQPFLSRTNSRAGITAFDLILREYGAMFFIAVVSAAVILLEPLVRSRDVRKQGFALGSIVAVAIVWMADVGGPLSDTLPLIQEAVLWEAGIVGALAVVALLLGDHDPDEMFVVVWGLFITAAAFTQIRFNYYLAVVVAVLTAAAVGRLMTALRVVDEQGRIQPDIEPYQVMVLMLALMLVLPGLVVPVQIGGSQQNPVQTYSSWERGNSSAPSAAVQWNGTLDWMQDNTPKEGSFGPGNDEEMDPYGTYERPPDGDFDYGEGTYGVMSWWDYGHWITVKGERIPNANPFQQGATTAANYLLAPNESRANAILAEMGGDGEQTRYVMVDWKMVQTMGRDAKFSAPTVFYDDQNVSSSDFVRPIFSPRGQQVTTLKKDRYFESMAVRLYKYHGSAASPQPYVIQWTTTQVEGQTFLFTRRNRPTVRQFETMAQAEAYARNHSNTQIGGFGNVPTKEIPALEHYRLVKASEEQAVSSASYQRSIVTQIRALQNVGQRQLLRNPNWVKVFERVEGAEVEGSGAPADTEIRVQVRMRMPSTNRTFTYYQRVQTDENGNFETTVPYSTTGYDEYGPEEGYTNVSVRAAGPYQVRYFQQANETAFEVYSGTFNVSEGQVIGEDDSPVRVELSRSVLGGNEGNETAGDDGNESDGSADNASSLSALPEDREPPAEGALDAPTDDAVTLTTVGTSSSDARAPTAPEPDDTLPDPETRGGLFALLVAGFALETRRD